MGRSRSNSNPMISFHSAGSRSTAENGHSICCRTLWTLSALILLALVEPTVGVAAGSGKTLSYSWVCNVGPLNPHLYSPNVMFGQAMVYEPLVRYGADGSLSPWLAESWEISSDGRTYTFHLRKGVSFSDGTPFNARAAKLTFDAVLANAARHAWLELMSQIREVRVVDDLTLAIHLKEPYYAILQDLALVRPFRFLSPAAYPASGGTAQGIRAPIGTGPWKLVESKLAEYDIFMRNESYWGPKPDIERIVVKVIPDPNTRAVVFETGEVDLIYGSDQISLDTFDRFRSDKRYSVQLSQPLTTRSLALNSKHGATADLVVRKAIQHAVNKDAIIKGIFLGTETRADTLLSPHIPYCDLGLALYEYLPGRAEELLEGAGWKRATPGGIRSKDGTPLIVKVTFVGNSALEKSMAEAIQGDLRKVGVQVSLEGLEEDIFSKRQKDGNFDLIFNETWGPPYEPHSFCSSMRVPAHADYQAQAGLPMKSDLDAKIGKALTTLDEGDRRELWHSVLTTLHEQAVYLPISYTTGIIVHGGSLSGVSYGCTAHEVPFEAMVKH
jgi:nickel transport system substrate-binding protein